MSMLLQIQFLYRLNLYITIFVSFNMSCIFVNLLSRYEDKFKNIVFIFVTILSLVQIGTAYRAINFNYSLQTKIIEKDIIPKIKNYQNWDYTAKKNFSPCEKYQYQNYLKHKNDPVKSRLFYCKVHSKEIYRNYSSNIYLNDVILRTKPNRYLNNYNLNIKSDLSGDLILPLTVTKGIEIKLNGELVKPIVSKYGTLLIKINKGHKVVNITYKWTLLARTSQFISLISFVLLMFYIFKNKTK